jgi:glycerophosphoryl diester phosphodiesterase
VVVVIATVLLGVYIGAMGVERRRGAHRVHEALPADRPAVVAHRGGALLRPENTMAAFRHAVELGADMLEMDLWTTRDRVPVVLHDGTVDRTTEGTGHVRDMTLAEVRRLDAAYHWSPVGQPDSFPYRGTGERVPTLEEVLEAFPHVPMTLEIKQVDPSMVGAVGGLIRRFERADRTIVASFDGGVLGDFRRRFPEVATSASQREGVAFMALHRLRLDPLHRPAFDVLQVPEERGPVRVVTPRFIRRAHAKNVPVQVWTVNDREDMQRLVAMGVDGIITDRPDVALEVVAAGR